MSFFNIQQRKFRDFRRRKEVYVEEIGTLLTPHQGRFSEVSWEPYRAWKPTHWRALSPERPRRQHRHIWQIASETYYPKFAKKSKTDIFLQCQHCDLRRWFT